MRMPEMDGAAFLEQVASRWSMTVRILLTGYSDITSTIDAVNKGQIYRYISKPWEDNDILLTVKRALEQQRLEKERRRLETLIRKQNKQLKTLNATLEDKVAARTGELQQTVSFLELAHDSLNDSYRSTVEVFSNIIEMREHQTSGRTRKIAELAEHMAIEMGMDEADTQQLRFAALLRNVGKISLSDSLLKKSFNTMTDHEHKTYTQHPIVGEGILMALEPLQDAARLIHHQHEHIDGSGYPEKRKGDSIPVAARILKVAGDYYDLQQGLLVTEFLNANDARDYIIRHRGSYYDPKSVDVFRKVISRLAERNEQVAERRLKSNGLASGMVLSRDLILQDEVLLLSQGHCLTEGIIERIYNLEEAIDYDLEIYVLADKEK
jgi:response regulator RpfG family c-di-GMP phosphodiesterase